MVFDQFQPNERSQLKRRSYASSPNVFRSVDALNNCSSWSDPLIFADRNSVGSLNLLGSSIRAAVTGVAYLGFPLLVSLLQPIIYMTDGSLSDEVRVGLTSSFLPGISLLFGALLSYTISLLVNRQNKIEDLVNEEVAHLSTATWHVADLWRWDAERRRRALEAIWRHTDQLIFRSRYQEILGIVQEDPIADLMQMVISVDEKELAGHAHSDKPNIDREVLNFLRSITMELNRLRTLRLSSEGRVLPPAHFVILAALAALLVLGFTLVSVQPTAAIAAAAAASVTPDGADAASAASVATMAQSAGGNSVAFESRLLFTGLVFAYSLLLEFALDLTNPFTGRYKIRRTTTTAGLIRIRNDITRTLGATHIAAFDLQLRRRKKAQLKEFADTAGQPLPIDGHL